MDGRTDGQEIRARHWKTAVFDGGDDSKTSGQFDLLLNHKPSHWKVYTKKEICPDTGREHYQTHVDCGRTERLASLCKWIKYTKWLAVKGDKHIQNSIDYISKEATTAPGAEVITLQNEKFYRLHELLSVIAMAMIVYPDEGLLTPNGCKWEHQMLFKNAARFLISENLVWIDKLSNPVVAKMWNDFGDIILKRIRDEIRETGEPFIIEGSPSMEVDGVYAFSD